MVGNTRLEVRGASESREKRRACLRANSRASPIGTGESPWSESGRWLWGNNNPLHPTGRGAAGGGRPGVGQGLSTVRPDVTGPLRVEAG
jgi:hypothetical protein